MPVTASAVLLWLRQSTAHALGHGFQTKRFSARTVGLTAADEVVGAHAVRGEELHRSVIQKDLRTHRVRETMAAPPAATESGASATDWAVQ